MTAARICKHCYVSGRVQGVFYRATVAHKARELGIDGYAHNLADGRVEVLACGEPAVVDEFVSWLWIGSSVSKVMAVDVRIVEEREVPNGFTTA